MEPLLSKQNRQYIMGIAVILVIFGHLDMFSGVYNHSFLLFDIFKSGGLGVDIFFLASSYGLCYSFNNNSYKRFIVNRFKRIYPAYFFFLVFLIYTVHPDWDYISKTILFAYQATGLVIFTRESYMMEWYVSSMIVFYAIFPFFYRILASIRCQKQIYVVLIATIIISYLLGNLDIMATQRFVYRIPILVLGVYTYIYQSDKLFLLKIYFLVAAWGIIFYTRSERDIVTLPLILLALNFILQQNITSFLLSNRLRTFLSFCGRNSLEIYLGQQIAMHFFSLQYSMWMEYAIVILLTISLSVVFVTISKTTHKMIASIHEPLFSQKD